MNRQIAFYLELAARWYVFIAINVYGWAKMFGGQFFRQGKLPDLVKTKTIADLTGFELAWAFFGYSFVYVLFIGIFQVLGGFLLLFNRTKLMGVMILVPILLNIIIVDICFSISFGAMLNACFYLFLLLLIAWLNRERVIELWRVLIKAGDTMKSGSKGKLKIAAIVLILLLLFAAFEQFVLHALIP